MRRDLQPERSLEWFRFADAGARIPDHGFYRLEDARRDSRVSFDPVGKIFEKPVDV